MVVYTVHVTCQDIGGGATEADGGASAPVGPSVATPLSDTSESKIYIARLRQLSCCLHMVLYGDIRIFLCMWLHSLTINHDG